MQKFVAFLEMINAIILRKNLLGEEREHENRLG